MMNRDQSAPALTANTLDHAGDARSNTQAGARFLAAGLLLGAALLAGGRNGALNHLLVQLAALPLFYLLLRDWAATRLTWPARFALIALALAALQLLPLPPSLWMALPGGANASAALDLAGIEPGWRPLALDPQAAVMALASLFAPLVLYIGATTLTVEERRRLLVATAIFAGASALLGLVQKLTGGACLFDSAHCGQSTGLMINRNHHADIIIAGMLLIPLTVSDDARRQHAPLLSLAIMAMGFGVLATTSRMGLLLAAPAMVLALGMVWTLRRRWLAPLAALVPLGALGLWQLPALAPILARFSGSSEDERFVIAGNTLIAAREFWPWGSGYGSFVPVHAAFEDLDFVHSRFVVAAHNDYLQILLEGGLIGLLTLICALALFARAGWRLTEARAGAARWAPWWVVAVLLVHSLVDYPLRMAAVAAIFALCFASADASQHEIANPRIRP